MNKLPAAIIFDMDGLLFDSESLYRDAIMAAASELGYPFTAEDFLKLVGRPWSVNRVTLQVHIGAGGEVDAFRAAWIRHYDRVKATLALKAGVLELLDRLDELQLPRAICTSSSHADVEHNLSLYALLGRFDKIIASGDYTRGKPFPDPFLQAAATLGVPPAVCLALEDSHNGIRAAAAAGMQTVMVPDLLPASDEIRRFCKFVAHDLHEVCAYLGDPAAVGRGV
jgi:HAD superfamily hydrolase (TIGR01509 family)